MLKKYVGTYHVGHCAHIHNPGYLSFKIGTLCVLGKIWL